MPEKIREGIKITTMIAVIAACCGFLVWGGGKVWAASSFVTVNTTEHKQFKESAAEHAERLKTLEEFMIRLEPLAKWAEKKLNEE